MRVGWIGFHQEGILALREVVAAGHNVVGIVTLKPDRAAKRSAAFDYTALGNELGVPVYHVKNVNDEDAVAHLRSLNLDLGIVLGWSQILHPPALGCANIGMVGAHASLLPHNRGSAPVNWAIIRGETEGGNSLMWLSEGVDEGALIDQRGFPITRYDTCQTVYDKVAETNRDMVIALLQALASGQRPGVPQPESNEPILPRRRPADGNIQWDQPAECVYNFVRALARPYPGAFCELDGDVIKVWQAALLPMTTDAIPGTTLGPCCSPQRNACGQVVACEGGALLLLEVELSNGCVLSGAELSDQDWQGKTLAPARPQTKKKQHAA